MNDDQNQRIDEARRALSTVLEHQREAMDALTVAVRTLSDTLWAMVIDETFGSTAPPIPNVRLAARGRLVA
jgi:hypothetical protein